MNLLKFRRKSFAPLKKENLQKENLQKENLQKCLVLEKNIL
jgi:hypothetical protein